MVVVKVVRKSAICTAKRRESLGICERPEPDAWMTFHKQSVLGNALLRQQKYADAEPFLLKGYTGLKAREARIPPHLTQRLHASPRLPGGAVFRYRQTGRAREMASGAGEVCQVSVLLPRLGAPGRRLR